MSSSEAPRAAVQAHGQAHGDSVQGLNSRPRNSVLLAMSVALASAALLRAARGYRAFPSLDDYAYLPLAIARLDPTAYVRDLLARETPLHVPLLPPLVRVLEGTVGLAAGFWILTLALSFLTVLAMQRWQLALGGTGVLLPVATGLACLGRIDGLGRGDYDGVFGDAFHFQWAAICALLWCYDAVLRRQRARAGGFLVLSLICHPVVGAHGIFVTSIALACGLALTPRMRRTAWALLGFTATLAVAVTMWMGVAPRAEIAVSDLPATAQAILFRLPHEYDLDRLKGLLFLVVVSAGVYASARLQRTAPPHAAHMQVGLLAGHLVLLATAQVLYESRALSSWCQITSLPFQLSLTRTTPILLALAASAIATALEAALRAPRTVEHTAGGVGWLASRTILFGTAVTLLIVQLQWSWYLVASLGIAGVTLAGDWHAQVSKFLVGAWLVVALAGSGSFAWNSHLESELPSEQQELMEWAKLRTSRQALFIVPPSLEEFRWAARRAAYVDFKLVTPGNLRLAGIWHSRLEEVAVPDRLAREARGWEGIVEWDRTYARRNSLQRIEALLRATQADYFVWDRQGLRVPPFIAENRRPNDAIRTAWANERYTVYALRVPYDAATASEDAP